MIPKKRNLTITTAGNGTWRVTSSPRGISCPQTCTATFTDADKVVLTATADKDSDFTGWAETNALESSPAPSPSSASHSRLRQSSANIRWSASHSPLRQRKARRDRAPSDPPEVLGEPCAYDRGTVVTLTATPALPQERFRRLGRMRASAELHLYGDEVRQPRGFGDLRSKRGVSRDHVRSRSLSSIRPGPHSTSDGVGLWQAPGSHW